MRARDKYRNVFGQIDSLAEHVSWTTGVSNMLEWLAWSTNDLLGVTKTRYRQQIVGWSHDEAIRHCDLEEKQRYVSHKLKEELERSEQSERYAPPTSTIATPREALRRARYFSEDYLNKEFDIFWSLVADRYLDTFYEQFTRIMGGGEWFRHGNSGLFETSTEIREMQMDNLSYNPIEGLLVANELKLGGKKNRDQILKYALMFRLLRDRDFIDPDTRFLLLFIGDRNEQSEWNALIDKEVEYCQSSTKSTAKSALHADGLEIARTAEYASTTWNDLMSFNNTYLATLDPSVQQVEQKLISGFNETLAGKKFMQRGST